MDRTFEAWLAELNQIAGDAYGVPPMTAHTGEDCWHDMFEDGMTPHEAWDEEVACWEDA